MVRRLAVIFGLLLLVGLLAGQVSVPVIASPSREDPPPNPARSTILLVAYTAHEWWLARYSDNAIVCYLVVEHEDLPTDDEILTACGQTLYDKWRTTAPCVLGDGQSVQNCPGLYLLHAAAWPEEKQIEVELPLPAAWLTLENCNNDPATPNQCTMLPSLVISGEEPLPNETIISVSGFLGDMPFSCSGAVCSLPLSPTSSQGVEFEFWVESSFGDASEHYTGLARAVPWGDFMAPEGNSGSLQLWYVDVLSSRWRGEGRPASCSDVWQVLPPVGGLPPWLDTPARPEDLYSSYSFYYLSAMLIRNGVVDVSACADGGLQSETVASPCGVQAAYPALLEWQNQFDAEIYQTAQDAGVPAQLLKNVFTRESQFWPGIYQTYREAGLGQLTDRGADTMLLWNPDFYTQFCPLVLHQTRCDLGFGNLLASEQEMLRGALVRKVNASCPDCPAGIDLSQANFSVRVFAEGLLANCEQVDRLVKNVTGYPARQLVGYEDLWRFTLANYNAGPGCLSEALDDAWKASQPLDWEHVAAYLDPACGGAIGYIDDVSLVLSGIQPTPTSWIYQGTSLPRLTVVSLQRTPTLLPESTATIAVSITPGGPTPTPTLTRTPMPTYAGYPIQTQGPTSTQPGYPIQTSNPTDTTYP
jgi:hypothetical protein